MQLIDANTTATASTTSSMDIFNLRSIRGYSHRITHIAHPLEQSVNVAGKTAKHRVFVALCLYPVRCTMFDSTFVSIRGYVVSSERNRATTMRKSVATSHLNKRQRQILHSFMCVAYRTLTARHIATPYAWCCHMPPLPRTSASFSMMCKWKLWVKRSSRALATIYSNLNTVGAANDDPQLGTCARALWLRWQWWLITCCLPQKEWYNCKYPPYSYATSRTRLFSRRKMSNSW